ncbi:MAG: amino acid adenylation domain-containing protein [Chloroflexi bacterium]|nr:amino acid adenylation domain-containing protein [Chloroflexota bacterium]MCI0648085.1 amino acid adenylation domain-containing protein [Chloroflexota bacterium]MCI0730916.1 amino acid adenylation domain-containing protein [Chloroflexota bacterium]
MKANLLFWRQQVGDYLPALHLPVDRPATFRHVFSGAWQPFRLDAATTGLLQAVAEEAGTTLAVVLLTAFQAVVYRYTGQENIIVVASLTRQPDDGQSLNPWAEAFPVRAALEGNPSFRALLQRVQAFLQAAGQQRGLPLPELAARLRPTSDTGSLPLFQLAFLFQDKPPAGSLRDWRVAGETVDADLVLVAARKGEEVTGGLIYNDSLFESATISALAGHWQTLLAGVAGDPARRLSDLPLLAPAERQRILVSWNDTHSPYSPEIFPGLFEQQAALRPNQPAIVAVAPDPAGDQTLTYGALNRRANQLARHLQSLGVRPGVFVAVYVERSADMIVALLGVLKAGGAYLPLDPLYPGERIVFMLQETQAPIILTTWEQMQHLPDHQARAICLDREWDTIATAGDENLPPAATAEDLAYVIYTSGSTGRPKGVQVRHRALSNFLAAMRRQPGLAETDTLFAVTTLSFDIAALELFLPLVVGGRVALASRLVASDGALLTARLADTGATVMQATPATWRLLVESGWLGDGRLKILCGGEALPGSLADQLLARGSSLWNLYGPTETTVWSAVYQIKEGSEVVPIGRPIANTTFYLLDRFLNPVPVGVPGELYIGGDGLAVGYLNRPGLTAGQFIPDPFSRTPGARLYKTGDLARYRPDGVVEFLGRIDHQVKVRGYRIELGEIEAVLGRHSGVLKAVVVAREDTPGERRLVLYLVPKPAGAPGPGELRRFLAGILPPYMIPAAFVYLDRLPLTPNGKVDRQALPTPGPARPELETPYVAPRNEVEQHLVAMWQKTLGLEKIGVDDNFFELGGDSLKGAAFIGGLQAELDEYIYVAALFEAPTITGLVAYLERFYPGATARLSARQPAGVAPAAPQSRVGAASVARMRQMLAATNPLRPGPAPPAVKNPPAIFILSPPRSGTTLLRVILAGHPRLFAPPELDLLTFNTLAERTAALSGPDSFRLEGTIRAIMAVKEASAEEAQQIMADCEAQGMTAGQFYRLLQTWIEPRTLVDKSILYAAWPEVLAQAETLFEDALYIHLLRRPDAVIHSFEDVRLDRIYFREQRLFSVRELAELLWLVSHQNILDFLKEVPSHRQHRLRFEDLVHQPEPSVTALCHFLGLEFHPDMLQPYTNRQQRMTDGIHSAPQSRMIGDVKFHGYRGIEATVADQWQAGSHEDFLSDITWRLGETLGYERPPGAGQPAPPVTAESLQPLSPETLDQERAKELLSNLDQLSDEQVAALLDSMLAGQGNVNE